MGEALFLPSYWFHYIISQDASIQCNARSGESNKGKDEIASCGFFRRKENSPEELSEVAQVERFQEDKGGVEPANRLRKGKRRKRIKSQGD
jgi:hypothetical protein